VGCGGVFELYARFVTPVRIRCLPAKETVMTLGLGTILLVVLIVLLIGALPSWPYSSGWGYGPTGGVGLLLVIVIVLLVLGVI
jgi:hypothetical protein